MLVIGMEMDLLTGSDFSLNIFSSHIENGLNKAKCDNTLSNLQHMHAHSHNLTM